ncbi:MAG: hypothetical protein ACM3JB_26440 [Acidobacteriaceae bacterium]
MSQQSLKGNNDSTRRRRTVRHHRFWRLHRAQRKFLAQAAVFLVFLVVLLKLWYWFVGPGL